MSNIADTISKGIASLKGTINDPEEQKKIELAESSLYEFGKQAWSYADHTSTYEDAPSFEPICRHLQAVTEGKIRKLCIGIPPGFAKSLSLVFWCCWEFIRNPRQTFLFLTYSDDFAQRDSNRCRDLIKSDWYQERWGHIVKIRDDRDAARRFDLEAGGTRFATSTQGGGTGARATRIVIDDGQKIEHAYSKVEKERVNHVFDSLVSGRGADPRKTTFVVVQQRLAPDDLTGHIMGTDQEDDDEGGPGRPNRQEKELRRRLLGYTNFFLPLEYDPKNKCSTPIWEDPRTEPGESLWPERYGPDEIAAWKIRLGPLGTAAQLQQNPTELGEGSLFPKDFKHFRVENDEKEQGNVIVLEGEIIRRFPERSCLWFQVFDTALKEEATNDFTACGTFVFTPDQDLLVYDMERERLPVPKQYDWILGRRLKYPRVMWQALEGRASGIGLLQEGRLKGTPFREIGPDWYQMHEVLRAQEASTRYGNGMVYHRKNRGWTVKLEGELHSYPFGKTDMATTVIYAALLVKKEQIFRLTTQGTTGLDAEKTETIHDRMRQRQNAGESHARRWGLFGLGGTDPWSIDEPRSKGRSMFGR
jgi:hypothetical protein